jgi:hypothetical protein
MSLQTSAGLTAPDKSLPPLPAEALAWKPPPNLRPQRCLTGAPAPSRLSTNSEAMRGQPFIPLVPEQDEVAMRAPSSAHVAASSWGVSIRTPPGNNPLRTQANGMGHVQYSSGAQPMQQQRNFGSASVPSFRNATHPPRPAPIATAFPFSQQRGQSSYRPEQPAFRDQQQPVRSVLDRNPTAPFFVSSSISRSANPNNTAAYLGEMKTESAPASASSEERKIRERRSNALSGTYEGELK